MRHLADIAPREVLVVTGSETHSKWFSDVVAEEIGPNAEALVVPGARHIDFYDRADVIPLTRTAEFFSRIRM